MSDQAPLATAAQTVLPRLHQLGGRASKFEKLAAGIAALLTGVAAVAAGVAQVCSAFAVEDKKSIETPSDN